jgi:uncharacterized protein (TIGR01777 family)
MALNILMSGASGLLGTATRRYLHARGDHVTALVRHDSTDAAEITWYPDRGVLNPATVGGFDAVINFSGAGIGDARWTRNRKAMLLKSRIGSTGLLSRSLVASGSPPTVFLSGSAIGWYGDRGDELLDETSPHGDGFLADLCEEWEEATADAAEAGVRVTHLRTGLVLSASGGVLGPLLPLFRIGAGGKLGNGRQWMSWITIDDYVRAIAFLLDNDLSGPVDLVGPDPVRNAEFTRALGLALGRPTVLTVPRFAIETRMGNEAAAEMALVSQRVAPMRLVEAGFSFDDDNIESALKRLLTPDET